MWSDSWFFHGNSLSNEHGNEQSTARTQGLVAAASGEGEELFLLEVLCGSDACAAVGGVFAFWALECGLMGAVWLIQSVW